MALPILYWMLECTACGSRLVVYDKYLKFVGSSYPKGAPPPPDGGYGGPPLPERYKCTKGCSRPLKVIGSIFRPNDEEMYLHDPHVRVKMTKAQSDEWRQLIQAAGTGSIWSKIRNCMQEIVLLVDRPK